MRKLVLLLLLLSMIPAAVHAAPPQGWPTVDQQLDKDKVARGSALEKLVRQNQEFNLLRPEEAYDNIRVPLWLRVHWRKNHPNVEYASTDPIGGYPLVLKEIYEWMVTHQDLKPGNPTHGKDGKALPPDYGKSLESSFEKASAGTNARISGAATNPRSESDIRVNYWDPTKIISGSNNIGGNGQQAMFFSTNSGATWGQTFLPLATGDAFHSDPTVDWFSDGKAIATAIGINSAGTQLRMRSYISTNNGATWTLDGTFSGSQTNADKQIVWVDHSNTSAFKDNAYACWHNGLPQFVNRRVGSGGTWGATPLQISGAETTGTAIGCDVKTNSSGDVFVFWPATGNRRILMGKSTNGGVSYAAPVIITTSFGSFDIGVPSFNGRRILIYVTGGAYRTSTKNNVYAAWADLSGDTGCTTAANEPGSSGASTCKARIWFSRSTNGGSTWSAPVKINNQAGLNDQYNPWMVVDETNGQLAIIYYDTVDDPTRRKTNVYYQASFDDGASWSTPLKVTTSQTDETITGADLGNQYGDYNALSGIAGTFFGSWTDRRSGGKEEIWTAAIQEGGTPCTPPAAPLGVTATAAGANQINLAWSPVVGATEYRIYRATTSGGPYTQVGTSTTTSFSNTGLACNTTYYYVIRAYNGCESINSTQVQATTASCPVCTTQTLYSNGFETATGLAGFTTGTFLSGGSTIDWRGVQTCTARAGTKIFRFGNTGCTTDYGNGRFAYAQPNGASGIAVPAGSTTTRLSFWHRRQFESGYDGGTITVSVNGTNYFYAPGTAIISGSYNGTTSTSCPPAGGGGVSVFTGSSASFTNTVVNLDAVCNLATGGTGGCAGQSVRVGFTAITDCTVVQDGWFLDDVTVTACVP